MSTSPVIKFTGVVDRYPRRLWAIYTRKPDSVVWELQEQSDGQVMVTNGYAYWSQFRDTMIVKRIGPREVALILRSR